MGGEDEAMIPTIDHRERLRRMEEACRQTRHQLDMIERRIIRKMTSLIPSLARRKSGYRRGKPPEPDAFLARYRSNLAAITAERQPEIDALSRKLVRQEATLSAYRERLSAGKPQPQTCGEV